MSKPKPRELRLLRRHMLTPHMLRVTLGGQGMEHFPSDQESAYVKLIFPQKDQGRPLMRSYTVRNQRPGEIDIDFVIHSEGGPASSWAVNAEIGTSIMVGGPGPKKLVNVEADWFLIIGDMTALPAISVNLEQLPANARGYAVVEVINEADVQPLAIPNGIDIQWLVNPHPGKYSDALLNAIRELRWLEGRASVWCACELSGMRHLRYYFRSLETLEKEDLYISSYWTLGVDQDEHNVLKRNLN